MTTPIVNKALTALRKFLQCLTSEELDTVLTGHKKIIVTETDKKVKNKKPVVEDVIEFDVIKTYPLNKDFWNTITHNQDDSLSTRVLRNQYIQEKYGITMCDPKLFFKDVNLFKQYIAQFETFNPCGNILLEINGGDQR